MAETSDDPNANDNALNRVVKKGAVVGAGIVAAAAIGSGIPSTGAQEQPEGSTTTTIVDETTPTTLAPPTEHNEIIDALAIEQKPPTPEAPAADAVKATPTHAG